MVKWCISPHILLFFDEKLLRFAQIGLFLLGNCGRAQIPQPGVKVIHKGFLLKSLLTGDQFGAKSGGSPFWGVFALFREQSHAIWFLGK